MNQHPVVLQQGIHAIPFDEGNVIGIFEDRDVHGLPEEKKRIAPYAGLSKINPEDHADQNELDAKQYAQIADDKRIFAPDQKKSKDEIPEHPQQKGSFLSFPKCRQDVFHRQVIRYVFPDIMVLVSEIRHHPQDQANDPKD